MSATEGRYEMAQVSEVWTEPQEGKLRLQVRGDAEGVLVEVVYGGTATLADAPREVLEYALDRLVKDLYTGRLVLKEDGHGR